MRLLLLLLRLCLLGDTVGDIVDDIEAGNAALIQEVNRKAVLTAVGILVLCVIIYWVAKLAIYLTTTLWEWISGLF